jgi:nucleoside-diphosphate-sugar epimerase
MKKSTEIAFRLVADGVLLLLASAFGMLVGFAFGAESGKSFGTFAAEHIVAPITLLAICLPSFFFAGFYTKGRSYSTSYKPIFVAQVSGVAVLAWGFLLFMLGRNFEASRWVVMSTGVLAVTLVIGARIWSMVWTKVNQKSTARLSTSSAAFDEYRPKSVLVIGGAGYIGSGLLRKLLDKGYRVRLVDAFMFGEEPIASMIGHENLEIVRADFRQIDKVVESMRGMDAVVHLGAIVGDPACALDEDFTIEVNLMATQMIAECAKGFGIKKFIFASTCSVYGASDEVLNEKSHLNPVSLYARSKIACERILLEMQDEKFKPTILRFGTVFGLSGRTRFDLVVNLLTAKAIVDGKITVFGEDQWRPFVHVDDASLAVAMALEAPLEVTGGETFNVGADEGNYTLGDVGRLIQKFVPTAELIASGSDGDRRNYRVDFAKIKNLIGFKAQWTLEMGVKQVIQAFEQGKVEDYNAPQYSNVKLLSEEASVRGLMTEAQRLRNMVEEGAYDQGILRSN